MKTLRYIIITLLLVAALQAARGQYVIDKVCLGAQRHYRIDGLANSTYLWQLTDASNNPVTITNPAGTSFTTTNPPTTGSEIIIQWAKPLINPGTYKLIAIQYSQAGCDTLQQGEVQVFDLPTDNAGNPATICAGSTVNLSEASATNYSTLVWTSSGDGVFDNPALLHPVYSPGTNDILSGNVTLTLTADGQGNSGSCTPAVSSLTVTINKVVPASVSVTADQTTVCTGAIVTFTAVPVNGGTAPVYQWTVNGTNVGTSAATYAFAPVNGDKVSVVMTSNETCVSGNPANSNELTITVNNPLPASVSVTADQTTVCAGATVTFTAVPVNGGTAPVYQWTVNGTNVGTSAATYAFAPVNGDKVSVVMTSNETCVSGNPANSNELTITVNNPLPASVSVTADQTTVCAGSTVTFTAVPVNGGTAPVYQWTVNGTNVGTSAATYAFAPVNGDKVSVVMTSNETCVSGNPANSNELTITVNNPLPASVSVTADQTTVCAGATVTFTAVPVNGGTAPVYQWTVNGTNVGTSAATYAFAPVNGDKVSVVMTSNETCVSGNPANSNELTITVNNPLPASVSVTADQTTVCAGATVTFTAVPVNGGTAPVYQWTVNGNNVGTSAATYAFAPVNGDKVSVVMTSNETCVSGNPANSNELTITVNNPLPASVSVTADQTTVCAGATVTFTAVPVNGGTAPVYQWTVNGNNVGTSAATYAFAPVNGDKVSVVMTSNETCVSGNPANSNELIITINNAPFAPIVGTITQPTCTFTTGSVVLSGLPSGNWTINPGTIAESTTSTTISGLIAGKYNFTVIDAIGCNSSQSADVVIDPVPIAPVAPTASVTVQPTCAVVTGTIVVTAPAEGSGYSYSIDGGTTWSASATFVGLNSGNYNIIVKETATGCISAATTLTVNTAPLAPVAPTASVTVQPTCAVGTGTIVITAPAEGSGYSYSIDGGTTWSASATFAGLNSGNYNITVKETATGCISAVTTLTVNTAPLAPAAPTASVTVQPTCAVGTGTIVITAPLDANLEYSIDGTVYQSGTAFAGLAPKTYAVTARYSIDPTCVSVATSLTVNPAPEAPAAPTASVTVQPTCSVATGTIVITAPLGAGLEYSIDGTVYQSGTAFAGLVPKTYAVTARSTTDPTCVSVATSLTVNPAPGAPAAPIIGTITQPTCTIATGSVVLSGLPSGNWTINPGTIAGSTTSTTISGLIPGKYNFTVTDAAGCTSSLSADVVIDPAPVAPAAPTASITVQPTCSAGTGTIVITAPLGTNLEYSIDGTVYQSGTAFAGLASKTYAVTARSTTDPTCVSVATSLTVNPAPGAPATPVANVTVQPSCSVTTGTIVIAAPLGANLEYSIDGTVYQSGTTFAGLAPKTYAVTARYSTDPTCVSVATALTVNTAPLAPAAPIIGTITQPTCTIATGSVVLSGLPSGNWTINPGTIAGSTTSTTISGLIAGKYNFTVTDAAGCTSSLSADVVVDPVPIAPVAPTASVTVQPTCAVGTGTIVVTAPLGADLEYSIDGTVYQSGTTFAGLAPKTYAVTARYSTDPTCVSAATALTVNTAPLAPAAPIIGSITQPTCTIATGSVVLSGLPSGNWTINPGTIAGSTTSTTISGLIAGKYNFTVTDAAGCTSSLSADVVIDPVPVAPAAPTASVTVQPSCSVATGTIVITAPLGANLEYSIDGTVYQSGTAFAGLVPKTYAVTARSTTDPTCVSVATSLTVNPAPGAPAAPTASVTIQPSCSVATGTIVITSPAEGSGYSYSIDGGTTWSASATFAGLISGNYNITVKETATGCISAATTLTVNTAPLAPAAPTASVTVQPTCAVGTGTIVITAPAEGSGYSYSIDGGTTWSASATFAGLNSGNYNITVKETATGCISAVTTLTVNTAPPAPAAPTASVTVQPTCAVSTGTIVVTAPAEGSGYSYSIDGGTTWSASATFVGLISGNYNIIVKETATGCISAATTLTVNTAPLAPAAPTASVTVQPTCAVSTGTIVVTAPAEGSGYSYSIDGGTTWSASATFVGLNSGNYNITVKETATGCISAATTLTVNTAPLAPAAPTASVTVQPTCAVSTGTIVVTAPAEGSGYSYSIDGGTTWSASATFVGLNSGNYNITVKETATGCISAATTLTVNTAPLAPAAPTASVTVQPTCAVGTGTIVVTAPAEGSGYSYSIDGGTTWSASATFVGLNSGNYNITVKETATGCISAATTLTVNTAPLAPAAPTASVTVQPTCAVGTGTIVVTAPAEGSGYSYSIDGGTTWSASATFAGLNSGNYNITVKETATGCISAATTLTVNTAPLAPAAPTASVTVQPTCAVGTGTIVVTAPAEGSGYSYSIDGGTTWSASATFAGLISGNYNIIVKETATGCISAATTLTVNTAPLAPAAPTASVTVQPTCAVGTGTIVVTAPAEGSGYSYSIDGGTTWSASATFAGLNSGNYNITVKETATGCISAATTLTVNTAPLAPAALIIGTITQPTCTIATGSVVLSGLPSGNWTINPGTIAGSTTSTTISGLIDGKYNFTVTDAAGCTSSLSADVVIDPAPGAPAAPTASVTIQPSCSVATGTIVITSPLGANLEYSIDGTVYQSGTAFAGLASKTYAVTARSTTDPTCLSVATSLTVNPAPEAPAAPIIGTITQPTCTIATGSVVLSGLPSGNWTINPGTIAGSTTSTTISGLIAGKYNFTVTDAAGCNSSQSADVVIDPVPIAPAAPTASVTIQPSCSVATGTIVIASPLGANLEYRIDGTVYQSGTAFAGLAPKTYAVTARYSTDPTCVSAATSLTVNPAPGAPATPIASVTVQPSCAVGTGTIVITAPLGANLEYSIDGTVYQSGTTFAGLVPKTYAVTARYSNDPTCVSATTSLTVNPAPGAPAAPTASVTVQPSCAVGTGTIVVTAPLGADLEYSIDGTVFQSGTTFAGLAPKTYAVTARYSTDPTCVSVTTSLTVNPAPGAPATPIASVTVQPWCSVATGTIVITAPAEGSGYSYSIDGGTTWSASATFAGLNSGNYNIIVKETATGCISAATTLTVNTAPLAPAAPTASVTVQPTCAVGTGTIVVTAPLGADLEYSIDGTVFQSGTTFAGLAPKTYTVTVRSTTDPTCVSATTSLTVNPASGAPAAPTASVTIQPSCSVATGTIVITSPMGANLEYSIDETVYQSGTAFAGLAPKTYAVTARYSTDPTCVSVTTSLTVNPAPGAPAAPIIGTITQPTCTIATGSVVLSGLPSGNWTINPGEIAGSTTNATISGLIAGKYNFTVTDAIGCNSSQSADVVIDPVPIAPAAPTASVTIQPSCSVATGTIVIASPLGANLEYSIDETVYQSGTNFAGLAPKTYAVTARYSTDTTCVSVTTSLTVNPAPGAPAAPTASVTVQPSCSVTTGTIVFTAPLGAGLEYSIDGTVYQSGTTFAGLAPKTYAVTARYSTDPTCVSAATALTVNTAPDAPAAPIIGTITQPTCSFPTGNVVLSGLPAIGTWTLIRNPGGITATGTGTSTTVSGLSAGTTYTFTVTNSDGCTSSLSANVVINLSPATPVAPIVATITQPTCSTATGTVVLSGLPATGTWTLTRNPGGITTTGTGTTTTVSSLTAGTTYIFTVTNVAGCTSPPSASVVINAAPTVPTAPVIGVITQPTCAVPTGSVVLTGLPATGTWTLTRIPGGTTVTGTGTTTTVSGLTAGTTYTFTVTNVASCTSPPSVSVVIIAAPTVPTAPVIGVITQPTCAVPTGSVVLTGLPATGTWTLTRIPGGTTVTGTGTSRTVSGLTPAVNYTFTVTNTAGCTSLASVNVVINPVALITPSFSAIQPLCKGDDPVVLPIRSNNSTAITGTWSPAIISTTTAGTKRYYFIPDANQCSDTTSISVTIKDWITTNFNPIVNSVCQNTPAPALLTTSLNGITGTWDPPAINTSIVRTTTYSFTPTTGQCASSPTVDVTIIGKINPLIAEIGPFCQGSTPPSLPSSSTNGVTGTWNPSVISTAAIGTRAYNFNPDANQCAWVIAKDITVNPKVKPDFDQIAPLCQNSAAPSLPLKSTNGFTGTWSPSTISTSSAGKTTFTFTPDPDQCATSTTMDITVNEVMNPVFIQIDPLCQNSTAPILPAVSTNGINGTWNPSTISTLAAGTKTYTFTSSPATCPPTAAMNITVNPQVTPLFNAIGPLCQNSTPPTLPINSTNGVTGSWSPATINTTNVTTTKYIFTPNNDQCAVPTTMEITINAPAIPQFTSIGPLCQNGAAPDLPITSTNGITGTWNPSTINTAKSGTTSYQFTPQSGQCAVQMPMDVFINPTVTSTTSESVCNNELPFIWNGNNFNAAGSYNIKLVSQTGCDSIATLNLNLVNALTPTFTQLDPILQNSVAPLLPSASLNGITGTWSPATISTTTSGTKTYTFIPDPGQCATSATMNIEIEIKAVISYGEIIPGAEGILIGACQQINLDASKSIGSIVKYEWSLLDQGGVLTNQSGINTDFLLSSDYSGKLPANFRVRLRITDQSGNNDSQEVTIHIDPPPIASVFSSGKIEKDGSMIVDGTVSTGEAINYKWSTNEGNIIGPDNQPTANFFGAGWYKLEVTDIHGCMATKDFKFPIEVYQIFVNPDYVRIPWTQDTIINVLENDRSSAGFIPGQVRVIQPPTHGAAKPNTDGTITYQPSERKPGHDLFIYEACDRIGLCDSAVVTIDIYESQIILPEGLSPNGDGKNDFFVIKGLQNYKNSQLYVYTRAGQLVYQSKDYQNDWNGRTIQSTLTNLELVPTGTYYYILKLGDTNRTIKGFVYVGY